jgi:hypothetical protein
MQKESPAVAAANLKLQEIQSEKARIMKELEELYICVPHTKQEGTETYCYKPEGSNQHLVVTKQALGIWMLAVVSSFSCHRI